MGFLKALIWGVFIKWIFMGVFSTFLYNEIPTTHGQKSVNVFFLMQLEVYDTQMGIYKRQGTQLYCRC